MGISRTGDLDFSPRGTSLPSVAVGEATPEAAAAAQALSGNEAPLPEPEAERYRFTARDFDHDTALQHNAATAYNPSVGRWLAQDPVGFAAGDANLYRYVAATGASAPLGEENGPSRE